MASVYKDSVIAYFYLNEEKSADFNIAHKRIIEENLQIKQKNNKIISQKNTAYFWVVMFLSISLVLGFSILIYRNKKNKQLLSVNKQLMEAKLNEIKIQEENLKLEVKSKNLDLNQFATNLTLKREFIDEQKEKLNELKMLEGVELKHGLKKYITEIENFETTDILLRLFQKNTEDINSKLFYNLKKTFPNLTKNDIQICALHLLNLTTKDIAIIRNVTPKAVQIARYRIKKKMNLSMDEDIVSYIEENIL